jgi:hypothetical protein
VQGCTAVGDSQREPAKHKQIHSLHRCFADDLKSIILIYFKTRLIGRPSGVNNTAPSLPIQTLQKMSAGIFKHPFAKPE